MSASLPNNKFLFRHSTLLPGVTALNATMGDFSYEKHAHEEFALGVTLAGQQDFWCKGAFYRSLPGNLILFNPEDVHDGTPGSADGLRYVMLYVHADTLAPLINAAAGRDDGGLPRFGETLLCDAALRRRTLALARLMDGVQATRLELEAHLMDIAERLARRTGRPEPDAHSGLRDSLLMRAKDYIHDNPTADLSLDELAGVANLSKFHFLRLFRRQFGITPHQYVLNCRINAARAALEQGTPPTETAHMFAFSDVSHLNRRFKRFYGLTPRQYQLQSSR